MPPPYVVRARSRLPSFAVIDRYRAVVDGMALRWMFNRAIHMQKCRAGRQEREFSIINIRLNPVERGYRANAYKFNNRKDDAVFQ